MPCSWSRVDPHGDQLGEFLVDRRELAGSTTSRRRVLPARSRGLTDAIIARVWRADRNFLAPLLQLNLPVGRRFRRATCSAGLRGLNVTSRSSAIR